MAGRLDGYVNGRPVNVVAENRVLTLGVGKVTTLLTLRRSWQSFIQPLRAVLERAGIRLVVRTRWLGTVEVFPNPNRLLRLLLPKA